MVSKELIERTVKYGEDEQDTFLGYADEELQILKESAVYVKGQPSRVFFTINAYKGLVGLQRSRAMYGSPEQIKRSEDFIHRYEQVIENLSILPKIPAITSDSDLNKALHDLKEILDRDIKLRGNKPLQDSFRQAIIRIQGWGNGVGLSMAVIRNVDSRKNEIKSLEKLKDYLTSIGFDTEEVKKLIKEWETVVQFKTVVFALYYTQPSGWRHGISEEQAKREGTSEGTYVLFSVDLNDTDPKTLFGTNLNRDNDDSKQNIYYWFKTKYVPVSEKDWNEKKKHLELSGYGYVSDTIKETVSKTRFDRETSSWVTKEYVYPARIYDKAEFKVQYLLWKAHWMEALNLTEAGWSKMVAGYNPYVEGM